MKPLGIVLLLTVLLCAACASSGPKPSQRPTATSEVGTDATGHAGSGNPAAPATQQEAPAVEPRVRLGVHCEKVTAELAHQAHLSAETGVRVVTVEAGSVAQQYGIKVGDIILKYGDQPITEVNELAAAIAATNWGAVVPITISRRTGQEDVLVQF
jgi:S1-C subfamily serine protease